MPICVIGCVNWHLGPSTAKLETVKIERYNSHIFFLHFGYVPINDITKYRDFDHGVSVSVAQFGSAIVILIGCKIIRILRLANGDD